MVYYEPVKIIINALGLVEVIIDMVVWHYRIPNSIVTNKGFLFISKFSSSLRYFLGIKRRLSTMFYPQTEGQTEWQISIIEVYLQVFVNFQQND